MFFFTNRRRDEDENWSEFKGPVGFRLFGTNLSFEVVLPFRCLQSFETPAAVGRHRHTQWPMDTGEQLGSQGHMVRPWFGVFVSTHDEIWTGA